MFHEIEKKINCYFRVKIIFTFDLLSCDFFQTREIGYCFEEEGQRSR